MDHQTGLGLVENLFLIIHILTEFLSLPILHCIMNSVTHRILASQLILSTGFVYLG